MRKQRILMATALSLLTSAALVQAADSVPAQKGTEQQCKDLTGAALDACLKAAPGKSGDAASRAGDKTPGASESAASRTGTPPGQATDSVGTTKGGSDTKAGSTTKGGAPTKY